MFWKKHTVSTTRADFDSVLTCTQITFLRNLESPPSCWSWSPRRLEHINISNPKNGDGMFVQDVGIYLQAHTASQSMMTSLSSPPGEHHFSKSNSEPLPYALPYKRPAFSSRVPHFLIYTAVRFRYFYHPTTRSFNVGKNSAAVISAALRRADLYCPSPCIRIVCVHTVITRIFTKSPPALSVDRMATWNLQHRKMTLMQRIQLHLLHTEKVETFATESCYMNTETSLKKLTFHEVQTPLGAINEVWF
jgi:hypothetical protein